MALRELEGQWETARPAYWRRVLRPLFLWFLLVLVLYGIHLHQRLNAQTRLRFAIVNPSQASDFSPSGFFAPEAAAQLDGHPFDSGHVDIGWHQLVVTHPKAKTFSTNLFIWYGEHDLGTIKLERAKGSLTIKASPPALSVSVRGREAQKELSNVTSVSLATPTDDYIVTAFYPGFTEERKVTVTDNQESFCLFSPVVGILEMAFDHSGARYELRRVENSVMDYQIWASGELPAIRPDLKPGQYQLRANYQGVEKNWLVEISAERTNSIAVEFPLGNVVLETTPAGATVRDQAGNIRGVTPLTLNELPAGIWRGELTLSNYMTVPFAVEVKAQATVNFQTNLVRRVYGMAMALAARMRQEGSENFAPLIEAFSAAMQDDPSNAMAVEMWKRARVAQAVADARRKGQSGDYVGGLRDGESALAILPDNLQAQQLVTTFKKTLEEQQANAQAKQQRDLAALRLSRPRDYFVKLMGETAHSADFREQQMTLRGNVAAFRSKLASELAQSQMLTKFTVVANEQPFDEGFMIHCKRSKLDGWEDCFIVGGQTADGEVTVRFKVFEYTWPPNLTVSALFKKPAEELAVPINQSSLSSDAIQSTIALGIRLVAERIRGASQ